MQMSCETGKDPYVCFFPLGILMGLLGTGVWGTFALGWTQSYPGLLHSETMTTGFLFVVAVGFLMTAIPNFTATGKAHRIELRTALMLVLVMLGSFFIASRWVFHGAALALILFLFFYGGRRLRGAQHVPAPSFVLVGLGLIYALVALSILLWADFVAVATAWQQLARLFLNYGMFFGFALGIGTQLIPAIMGTQPLGRIQMQATPLSEHLFDWQRVRLFVFYGVILTVSFFLEAFGLLLPARWLRALLIAWILVQHWRIYLLPKTSGILPWCLGLCAVMLFVGVWVVAARPGYAVHGAHVIFIGSLSIMIFTIATRVTLAHGGHGLLLELRSKSLAAMAVLMLAALVTRLIAPFIGNYFSHLGYAAVAWTLAALTWSAVFIPKMFRK